MNVLSLIGSLVLGVGVGLAVSLLIVGIGLAALRLIVGRRRDD